MSIAFALLQGCGPEQVRDAAIGKPAMSVSDIIAGAKRIPEPSGWFEVLRLPNGVYAFWEPGHVEEVNAFLILGQTKDLLYDTGMGIASIGDAIAAVRLAEGLPERPLMVVNSHNHLDHNGGNADFPEVWTADVPWARKRLAMGVPAGSGFDEYWKQLSGYPGVALPADVDIHSHGIPAYPLEQVRYLNDGEVIDLGDRVFRVLRTYSHSPDGIALYDPANHTLFGGDAFYGALYLVLNLPLLATDLERVAPLRVDWHYSSHGPQLLEVMQHGRHLAAVRGMIEGEGAESTLDFAGFKLPKRELDGVSVSIATDLLLY